MRSLLHVIPRFISTYPAALVACSLILLASTSARADVVRMTEGRTIRVVGITTNGRQTTLSLVSGGVMIVASRSIESIDVEPVTADLCGASAFRCQDRAMLMLRHTQAQATAATVTRDHTPAPAAQP
ncbi:MAG: hypothetical protein JWO97_687 [Acidobacteria bacterium]|nr:hypothetical protein [Acidobacteriota bacterium]